MTRFLPHTHVPKYIFICSTIFFTFLCCTYSFAETTATAEWNISADKITRFEDPESIVAEGNIVLQKREKVPVPLPSVDIEAVSGWAELLEEEVEAELLTPDDLPQQEEIQYKTRATITADWVAYDVEKQSIRARGNVTIDTGDDQLYADEAQIDLTKEIGTLDNAKIIRKDHDLHLEGKKIEKTGVKTYRVEDGWVITCKVEDGETPPWSFSSAEATVEPGGYAVLKHAKFNIKDVPVLYLPYLIVPVKDSRQTGFIFPEFSNSSRNGFGFNLPLFVNISESVDMTIYPEFYADRGFMPGLDFRYVLNPDDKGRFTGSYLNDDLSDPSETEYYEDTGFTHTNSDRYWLRGKVDHTFGENWITRLDVDVVSDRDYLTEFYSGMTGFKESQESYLATYGRGFENRDEDQRSNTLAILRTWNGSSLNIDFLAVNDVSDDDVTLTTTDPTPLWQLPSVAYTGALPIADTNFTFDWNADYVNFWREEGIGGHRIDLFPKLSAPVPLGPYLESRAEAGVRGTMYSVETFGDATWNEDDTPNRFLLTFSTDLATTLVKNYTLENDTFSRLNHSIRPYIEYDYISDEDQDDLPDFDVVDRVDDVNAITYGVDTFFNLFDRSDRYSREYGYIRLEQSYDLRSEASDTPFMPVNLKLGWRPLQRMVLIYKTEIPIEDDQNTIHGLEGYYTNSRGDSFGLDYRFNDDENIEQINASFKARLLPVLEAAFEIEHSISEDETNLATIALTYLQQCWSVQLKAQYTPTDERISLVFNLANIGTPFGVNF